MDVEYEVSRESGGAQAASITEGRRGAVLGVARAGIGRGREETADPLTLYLSFLP